MVWPTLGSRTAKEQEQELQKFNFYIENSKQKSVNGVLSRWRRPWREAYIQYFVFLSVLV